MSDSLVVRPNIEQIVALRAQAMAAFEEAYDMQAAAQARAREGLTLQRAASSGFSYEGLHTVEGAPKFEAFTGFFGMPDRAQFMRDAQWQTDANIWEYLLKASMFHNLLDKEAKDDIRRGIMGLPTKDDIPKDFDERQRWERAGGKEAKGPPEVTGDNIAATLEGFLAQADIIWRRGIANVFTKLERRFKSHDGWKIGSRIVLDHAFRCDFGSPSWNSYREHRDSFQDIERVFMILDGKDPVAQYGGIVGAIDQNGQKNRDWKMTDEEKAAEEADYVRRNTFPIVVSGDFFRVRIFKNGNAHIWFKRDDLVVKVNKLLGEYYGEVIPADRKEPTDEEVIRGSFKMEVAKNFGFFPTPEAAAKRVIEKAGIEGRDGEILRILEPSAGTGNLARLAADGGKNGHPVDCIEIQEPLARKLELMGFPKVWRADFLSMTPESTGLYDRIIMNPPFDRERDIDHVTHALRFLKPGGRLVAIMSAGTEFRETKKSVAFRNMIEAKRVQDRWDNRGPFEDLPPGSFASVGTYVNTVILAITLK